ncbi:MAG: RPA family protein [Thermoplasmata archaeon]
MIREVAWRIFAGEYTDSNLEHSSGGERAPSYVITPLGAKVNRLFLVGVITDVEDVGSEGQPMWRARLSDPTGVFHIYAGQYQPEASAALSRLSPPAFCAIMGKARTYSPDEGVIYTSVRPEMVKLVDAPLRDYWILECAREMRKRIEGVVEAQRMNPATPDGLVALGYRKNLAEGIVLSLQHYGKVDLDRYRAMLADAVQYLLPEYQEKVEVSEEAEENEEEQLVLDIVSSLDRNGKGASWDEIVEAAKKKGLSKEGLEEMTNQLLDKGLLYEPILGKIRRI